MADQSLSDAAIQERGAIPRRLVRQARGPQKRLYAMLHVVRGRYSKVYSAYCFRKQTAAGGRLRNEEEP